MELISQIALAAATDSPQEVVMVLPQHPHPRVNYLLQLAMHPELIALTMWNPDHEVQYFPPVTFGAEASSPPSEATKGVLKACALQRLIDELATRHKYFAPPPPPPEFGLDEVIPSIEHDPMEGSSEDGSGDGTDSDWSDGMDMDIREELAEDEQEVADYLSSRYRLRELTPPSDVESIADDGDDAESGQNQAPNLTWPFVNVINQEILPSDERFLDIEIGDHAMMLLQSLFAMPFGFDSELHDLAEVCSRWGLNETVMARWTVYLRNRQLAKVESQMGRQDLKQEQDCDDGIDVTKTPSPIEESGGKPLLASVTTFSGQSWDDIGTAEDALMAIFVLLIEMIRNPRNLPFLSLVEQSRKARLLLFDLRKAITDLYFQIKPDSQATITSLGSRYSIPPYSPIRTEDIDVGSESEQRGCSVSSSDSKSAASEYVQIKKEDDEEQAPLFFTPSAKEQSPVLSQVPAGLTAQEMDGQIDFMLALQAAIEVWADTGYTVPVRGYRILPLLVPREH